MQKAQDESDGSSSATGTSGSEGVHQDPHKVNLLLEGFDVPGGHTDDVRHDIIQRMPMKGGTINWRRFQLQKLFITQPAHMLLLQGMPPAQLFLSASLKIHKERPESDLPHTFYKGPMIFIYGKLSDPWEAPAYFTDLVLGQPMRLPKEKSPTLVEVFAALHEYEAKLRKKT